MLILGDMLELGAWSEAEHSAVIEQAAQVSDAELFLVGSEFARAYAALPEPRPRAMLFASCGELLEAFAAAPVEDAFILIKGSHGIGLERLVPEL